MKKVLFLTTALIMSVVSMAASATYTKVTAAPTDWAGDYILVYEPSETAGRVFTGVDAASDFVEATISDNTITGEFVTLTLETTDGGYFVKVNGGDNDGKYFSSNTNANDLKFSNAGAVMTLSYDATNSTVLMTTPAGCVMRYNKTSGQDRFRFYKSTSYTGQQPVQLYKADGTPAPQKEIVSLEIGGTATKLEYFVGESFDPAGLTVTATYEDESSDDVTSKAELTIEPKTFAEASDNASVTVTAKIGEIVSEPLTVNNIVVTEKPAPVGLAYNKVTSEPTNWAGEYILVYEVDGAARVFNGLDAIEDFDNAEIKDNVIIGAFNTIILEAAEGGYLVKINGGDNNGKYINSDKDENGLKFGETGAVMTVSYDTESASTMIANPAGAVLRYNKTSGQDRFRFYKSTSYTNQQPVQLYKASNTPTAMPEVIENANVTKQLINGQLIIIRDNVRYNVAGQQL